VPLTPTITGDPSRDDQSKSMTESERVGRDRRKDEDDEGLKKQEMNAGARSRASPPAGERLALETAAEGRLRRRLDGREHCRDTRALVISATSEHDVSGLRATTDGRG